MPRIRVTTPSRLHFGLLALHPDARRLYGGVGLMVDAPGIELTVGPAKFSPSPPAGEGRGGGVVSDRADEFAQRFLASLTDSQRAAVPPFRLEVLRCAPQHAGLGTGTQLGMAVGAALAEWAGLAEACISPSPSVGEGRGGGDARISPAELARRVGRGARSAIGIHGFARGGLLVEGGKRSADAVSPLVARLDFPANWRLVLLIPAAQRGLSGREERQAFADLPVVAHSVTDRLCSTVLLGLLPAAAEADLAGFSEALFELQQQVGAYFRPAQGGVYASPLLEQAVAYLRGHGVTGVGQSSWGPTLYAVAGDPDRAAHIADLLRKRFPQAAGDILVARPDNVGARIVREP